MSADVLLRRLEGVEGRCVALQADAAKQVHALEITAAKAGAALERAQLEVGQQKTLIQKQDEEIRGLTGRLYALQDRLEQEMIRSGYFQGDLKANKSRNEGEIGRLQKIVEEKTRDREAMAEKLHALEDRLAQEERKAADVERNRRKEKEEFENTYDRTQDELVRRAVEYDVLAGQVDRQRDRLDQSRLNKEDLKRDLEAVQKKLKELRKGIFWLRVFAVFSNGAKEKLAAKKSAIKQLEEIL